MQKVFFLLVIIISTSCSSEKPIQKLELGTYRAVLQVLDNKELPFIFEVKTDSTLIIFNAEEEILVDEIEYKNDSVFIKLPFYEGYIAAIFEGENLKGNFIKESLDRIVPFSTEKTKERFLVTSEASQNITGNWEMVFSHDIEEDEYIAKGIFTQEGNNITGTIRTKTGDYRFLEGVMDGNQMKLSAFDGAHAFLFTATVTDSTLQGVFYSGNHFKEPFVAKRNDSFELPDEDTLTFLNEGYDTFAFSFPDTQGNMVSLTDERFKNKVVLVQIMGSWCPNCLDESKYYAEFYKNNKDKDFEIVALAFEYAKTEEKAYNSIARMKDRVGIDYTVLLAQFGTSNKAKAQEKLPMLNHVLSYPTTIYIDKKGVVRKIHTGFNGPATGEKYISFKKEFTEFIDTLLAE
ncbi:MAG: TlpA family protein disulfide reductase [Bacteroidetes bacterium]|nr:TlpA family protein disulfide reductase [Bacteroidota bacterium]